MRGRAVGTRNKDRGALPVADSREKVTVNFLIEVILCTQTLASTQRWKSLIPSRHSGTEMEDAINLKTQRYVLSITGAPPAELSIV
jgi:hypothetical protein